MDWSTLPVFLAIAETGSLSAASRKLGISQPTLSRRIMALEETLDTQLFQRRPKGLVLTEAGESIRMSVRQMEEGAFDIEKRLTGQNRNLEGAVSLTTSEYIGARWLTHDLISFREQYPGIRVDLRADLNMIDLLQRQADIALRLVRPTEPDLIARKVGKFSSYLAASKEYLEKNGTPRTPEDLKNHIALEYNNWSGGGPRTNLPKMFSNFMPENCLFSANSMLSLYQAVSNGLGIGLFPTIALDDYPDVEFVLKDELELELEVWLVTHVDIQHNARIRALYDFLADVMSERFKT